MADGYEKKEKVTGCYIPTAAQITFNRSWGRRRFTDDEVAALLRGELIEFESISAKGNPYVARGKLEETEYKGNKYWGFVLDTDSVPITWAGHKFTDDEITILRDGGNVFLPDCITRDGSRTYSCTVTWREDENGRKRIIPDFADKKKKSV